MKPNGRPPTAVAQLDDLVFDLDCSAEAQVDNTEDMLEIFVEIFQDGVVDHEDTPRVHAALRRTKIEHQLNHEQSRDMKLIRRLLNPFFELVASLRAKNQKLEAATTRG